MVKDLPTIVTVAFIPAIGALFAVVVAMGKGVITYLRDENRYLKEQRDGVMKTLVEVTKTQEASIGVIGEYVRELAEQKEYERRRGEERQRDGER